MESILEKIYRAGLKFLVPLTPEETYSIIVQEAIKLIDAEYGSIILEKDGQLVRVYASSPLAFQTKFRKRGNTYTAFKERKTVVADISKTGNFQYNPQIKKLGIKTTAFIPLSYQGKSVGVLTVNSCKKITNSAKELKILNLFGSMASLAIRKTQLYDEAQKALKARDLFTAMAAHELRTPVTTINGYMQLLYGKLPEMSAPVSRWVKEASWETVRLRLLINELLEASRINTGNFQYVFREHKIEDILQRAIMDFQMTHPDRAINFSNKITKGVGIVVGDFDKLLQVVINLIENAAKFSPPDKSINIFINSKESHIILGVQDYGVGIAKKDLPKIFERFYRGDENAADGMGLGLFLAKNIIFHHHGTIDVKSKLNKGTLVEVSLPEAKT